MSTGTPCLSDGELRAVADGALSETEDRSRLAHIESCPLCPQRLERTRDDATAVEQLMDRTLPNASAPNAALAYHRLRERTAVHSAVVGYAKGGSLMSHIASTRRRGAVAGIVAIMAMALFVAIAPVGTLAQDMLNRFRVQQFAAITIPMDLVEGMSSQMQNVDPAVKDQAEAAAQALGSFSTTFERGSIHQAASLDEANAQLNGSLSVPSTLPGAFAGAQPQAYYSDPGTAAYAVNVEQARGLLSTFGLSATALPDPSQEATVTISADVPAAAALVYQADGKYLVAGQFVSPGPSLDIPSSVDVNLLREEVLALPGLPPDIVAQLRL